MKDDLSKARAQLLALEQQTGALEAQAQQEAQAVTQAQQAARSGRATLDDVVRAKGRSDAAQGLLSQHLSDVQEARSQVDDLEAQRSEAQFIDDARQAQQEAQQTQTEAAQVVAEAEAALSAALERLQALEAQHRAARGRVWSAGKAHAARALALPEADISQIIDWNSRGLGLQGSAGVERRQAVEQALRNFAAQVGTDLQSITATANRTAPELVTGRLAALMPRRFQ